MIISRCVFRLEMIVKESLGTTTTVDFAVDSLDVVKKVVVELTKLARQYGLQSD